MERGILGGFVATALAFADLAGCAGRSGADPAPPRSSAAIEIEPQASTLSIPLEADLAPLYSELERAVPRRLWTIDRPNEQCVSSRKVRVAGIGIKTPTIRCHLVGRVDRGPLAFSGTGQNLVVTMPIKARVEARDIGGVIAGEEATAEARVRAIVRIDLRQDWRLTGKVDIRYDWTEEPSIDFHGVRIGFASRADRRLASIITSLERTLARQLQEISLEQEAARLWRSAFVTLDLNGKNPPVWLRVRPRAINYGGYSLAAHTATIRMGLEAETLTFVGDRPADPEPAPLPPPGRIEAGTQTGRFAMQIPVIADYAQLEPVIARALAKRSAQPFEVTGIGPVQAEFGNVTVYGTDGGRLAVGVEFSARDAARHLPGASGKVWLTGRPVNDPNSRQIRIEDFDFASRTDSRVADILIDLAATPAFKQTVGNALAQDFSSDYQNLIEKIEDAIAERREGNVAIRAQIDEIETGRVVAAGRGLYLPVRATGTASARYVP